MLAIFGFLNITEYNIKVDARGWLAVRGWGVLSILKSFAGKFKKRILQKKKLDFFFLICGQLFSCCCCFYCCVVCWSPNCRRLCPQCSNHLKPQYSGDWLEGIFWFEGQQGVYLIWTRDFGGKKMEEFNIYLTFILNKIF